MPIADVGGFSNEPALSLCNDTLQELLAQPFNWKFNSKTAPLLVTQMYRQDYLFAGASAFTSEGGVGIDLKSNNAITAVGTTITVKCLQPHNFSVGKTVYMTGNTVDAYNSVFNQTPAGSSWSGGWVITSTPDTKTFVFTHGTSGLAASGAPGITDASWLESCTMIDVNATDPLPRPWIVKAVRTLQPSSTTSRPEKVSLVSESNGVITVRFANVPGSTVWGVSLVYQAKAPSKTDLTQNWSPFPDEFGFVFRQMFLARCYRYLDHKRADNEYLKAQAMVKKALGHDDTEDSDQHVSPETTLMGDYGYGF